jgi:hypothetical protein
MTHIMTPSGWQPLYDTAPVWASRHAAVAEAEAKLEETRHMPVETIREQKDQHMAYMAASEGVYVANGRLLGAS